MTSENLIIEIQKNLNRIGKQIRSKGFRSLKIQLFPDFDFVEN